MTQGRADYAAKPLSPDYNCGDIAIAYSERFEPPLRGALVQVTKPRKWQYVPYDDGTPRHARCYVVRVIAPSRGDETLVLLPQELWPCLEAKVRVRNSVQ